MNPDRLLVILPPLALLLAIVGAWELYVDLGGVSPALLAAPHAWSQAQ